MSFYTPAGTRVLNLPEQVQKNLEDIAELKTLVGTKQDSSTAVTTANLKESVEAVGSFDLKDISTTSITNTGNLTNTGTADIEGDTNLGSNVEVDGNATLNSPENALFKTGSLDFSKITDFISTFYYNAFVGAFAGMTLHGNETDYTNDFNLTALTPAIAKATNISLILASSLISSFTGEVIVRATFKGQVVRAWGAFDHLKWEYNGNNILYLNNATLQFFWSFRYSNVKKVLIEDGYTSAISSLQYAFASASSLTEIGAFDVSACATKDSVAHAFDSCTSLKSIHCTHWKVSFNISASTQFEEADLVEIIGNLDTVSTAQTLTMGSTNLAKLTEDEILVATGKGWTLA